MRLFPEISPAVFAIVGGDVSLNQKTLQKGSPVVIILTGADVLERTLSEDNPLLARIRANTDIVRSESPLPDGNVEVAFIKKTLADKAMSMLTSTGAYAVGTCVMKSADNDAIRRIMGEIIFKELTLRKLYKNPVITDNICSAVYMRLRLPVLVTFLVVLLGNWFVYSALSHKIGKTRIDAERIAVQFRQMEKVSQKQHDMMRRMTGIPVFSRASLLDAIASKVPDGVMLTLLEIRAAGDGKDALARVSVTLRICGTASSENLMTFISSLKTETRFSGLSIVSYGRSGHSRDTNAFELSIPI